LFSNISLKEAITDESHHKPLQTSQNILLERLIGRNQIGLQNAINLRHHITLSITSFFIWSNSLMTDGIGSTGTMINSKDIGCTPTRSFHAGVMAWDGLEEQLKETPHEVLVFPKLGIAQNLRVLNRKNRLRLETTTMKISWTKILPKQKLLPKPSFNLPFSLILQKK
jgi:hypothetical protein